MNTVWLIVKFIIYTYALIMLYRQSYNLLFFLARRPITWIGFVGFLGISNMALAYLLEWDPRLVSAAVITAILLNIAPSPPVGYTKEEMRSMVNEIYIELGLPHGRLQSKIGLAMFGLCSLGSYILFFTEVCSRVGSCTPLIHTLTK